MSYANRQFSSDLSAFRSDGIVYTGSITFSGTIAVGGSITVDSATISVANLDYYKLQYDNSIYSPGKFRDVEMEFQTSVSETTTPSVLTAIMTVLLSGNDLKLRGVMLNPYSSVITLQTTTINFRVVAYDATA
jgi:hypothetical protein